MKIEFKKVPYDEKELFCEYNSVRIEGNFCKILKSLVKIEANLKGDIKLDCCRCGNLHNAEVNEEIKLILSDGLFNHNDNDDFNVIEIENSLIDFDEIIESEINSIKSDYFICEDCLQNNIILEKEF